MPTSTDPVRPSPSKSFRSRIGGVMRRTSSIVAISRPPTPSRASSGDSASLKHLDMLTTSQPSSDSHVPSPIAESPSREAEALIPEPKGPSPLANTVPIVAPTDVPANPQQPLTEPAAVEEAQPAESQGYQPPPISQYSAGPGAFTDEPEEMHRSEDIPRAPVIENPVVNTEIQSQPPAPLPADNPIFNTETNPQSSLPILVPVTDPVRVEPEPPAHVDQAVETVVPPPPSLTVADGAASYFDLPPSQTIVPPVAQPPPAFEKSVEENAVRTQEPTTSQKDPEPTNTQNVTDVSATVIPRGLDEGGRSTVISKASNSTMYTGDEPYAPAAPMFPQSQMSTKPSKDSLASSVKADQGRQIIPVIHEHNGNADYGAPSMPTPWEDPFADPQPIAPAITVSHVDPFSMPAPKHFEPEYILQPPPPVSYEQESRAPVVMPLPDIRDVIPGRSIQNMPSASTTARGGAEPADRDIDETRPLLSRPGTPQGLTSYLSASANPLSHMTVSPRAGDTSSWPTSASHLHNLGWIEYVLPDASFYYVHPTMRVTTDINLRSSKKLQAVSAQFDRKDRGAPPGWELWLREAGKSKRDTVLVRTWVDHRKRAVTLEAPSGSDGDSMRSTGDEDRLDMEFRYWSFMESHPAHTSLPANAQTEAMDALTWSYADRLLPAPQPVPSPFTQEECQELMNMLRSFGAGSSDSGIQTVVHTRLVSRVLLRVAQWRQLYFRPDKPLPHDIHKHTSRHPGRRVPFRRALSELVVGVLCLGIPYIFFDRSHNPRVDEESGIRSAAPMLMIGACTCLVAAIVLSASVTFLSLPGLDSVARVAALVSILCSTASMVSSVIALFRYKANVERAMSNVGGEGLVVQSRRSIIMSLPLVFLTYAIIGFVTGIVLYSFRGVTHTSPALIVHQFDDYTRWTVVGVLGGLAGVMTMSALLARR